jgi:uncharacterized protein YecT (DUF1311 family)
MRPTCGSLVSISACTSRIEVSVRTQFLRITGLMLGLLTSSCLAMGQTHKQKPDPCKDTSHMSQADMNDCALTNLHEAELKLERLLKQLGIAANSPEQKAWEAYRDAQLAAVYPPGDTSSYGSVYPMCLAILKQALTEGRIRDLKALTTSGEGDVCYGYRASGSKSN